MDKTAVILAGGRQDAEFLQKVLTKESFDLVIAADRGMDFFAKSGLVPTHIIGDFDSVKPEVLSHFRQIPGISFEELLPEKDDTDTEHAIDVALREGAKEILLLGVLGGRVDHSLSAIYLMKKVWDAGAVCRIMDRQNLMYLCQGELTISKEKQYGKYISFIPYGEKAEGVDLTGFKYDGRNLCLKKSSSLGISNEILADRAKVSCRDGILIVCETRDGEAMDV